MNTIILLHVPAHLVIVLEVVVLALPVLLLVVGEGFVERNTEQNAHIGRLLAMQQGLGAPFARLQPGWRHEFGIECLWLTEKSAKLYRCPWD